jgi:hypothetical protein
VTAPAIVAAAAIVFVGSVLQGSIGFGLGLLAAPLLLLVDARLVPGPLLVTSGVLTILLTHRERHGIVLGDLKWALSGRVAGTAVAVAVLAALPPSGLELTFAAIIMLGVALSASGWHLPPRPGTLVGAGVLSGFMGTISTIGGPPLALIYQHESGPRIRGTLSAYFVVGVSISLVGLGLAGLFGVAQAALALLLIPAALAGFLASRHTARWLDRGYVRPVLLVVSAAAAAAIIARRLL